MAEIKGFGLIICILMVLMAYLKQAIPRGKMTVLMKSIVTIFILLSITEGIMNFDYAAVERLVGFSYSENDAAWIQAKNIVADDLKREFSCFLMEQSIDASIISVNVTSEQECFFITRVVVEGEDAAVAGSLLSARYQIDIDKIEVNN